MPRLRWKPGADERQWSASSDGGGYYVITHVEDKREVFVGSYKMADTTVTYYELEANGHVMPHEYTHFDDAAGAAHKLERERTP
jgi:hypothetical protein